VLRQGGSACPPRRRSEREQSPRSVCSRPSTTAVSGALASHCTEPRYRPGVIPGQPAGPRRASGCRRCRGRRSHLGGAGARILKTDRRTIVVAGVGDVTRYRSCGGRCAGRTKSAAVGRPQEPRVRPELILSREVGQQSIEALGCVRWRGGWPAEAIHTSQSRTKRRGAVGDRCGS